jgi:trimeric autotransporter adhesin
MKNRNIILTTILFTLGCFALPQGTQAVSPAPDGGYPGGNTAEGQNALLTLSTGQYNTAIGIFSLLSLTDSSFCTGVGAGALLANTSGRNTATGAGALLSNIAGTNNTANGTFALFSSTAGNDNTAIGDEALLVANNADGNTAVGSFALGANISGSLNTVIGAAAAITNTSGSSNTAVGLNSLFSNVSSDNNTAIGRGALGSSTDGHNTAVGFQALVAKTTGTDNVAVGINAGSNLTSGSNNIYLGSLGVATEDNTIRIGEAGVQTSAFIRGIRGATIGANALPVLIDGTGQLGTISSSRRYKKDIKAMEQASKAILSLKPVTFHYKSDKTGTAQFGLIAEEVAEVNPDLVVRDEKGEIYTVRYDAVNAMLLNEFLKEHKIVEEQQSKIDKQQANVAELKKDFRATVAQLTARLEEQAAQIQKVSAHLEMKKPAPQMAANHP